MGDPSRCVIWMSVDFRKHPKMQDCVLLRSRAYVCRNDTMAEVCMQVQYKLKQNYMSTLIYWGDRRNRADLMGSADLQNKQQPEPATIDSRNQSER